MKEKMHGGGIVTAGILADPFGIKHGGIRTKLLQKTLAYLGKHSGKKDHSTHRALGRYQGKQIATGGMTDQDKVSCILWDAFENSISIETRIGLRLISRQLGAHDSVTVFLQFGNQQVPTRRVLSGSVNEAETAHRILLLQGNRHPVANGQDGSE